MTPWAVIGRWRWVTTPATSTLLFGSHSHKPVGGDDTPLAQLVAQELGGVAVGRHAGGPQVGDGRLHRVHAGQAWRRAARDDALQPIRPRLHGRADRPQRLTSLEPEAARTRRPWPSPRVVAIATKARRRTRSSSDRAYGATGLDRLLASSLPTPRTEPIPRRTATSPTDSAHGSSVAAASDALRSGVRTTTPWRRASCTSECGSRSPSAGR